MIEIHCHGSVIFCHQHWWALLCNIVPCVIFCWFRSQIMSRGLSTVRGSAWLTIYMPPLVFSKVPYTKDYPLRKALVWTCNGSLHVWHLTAAWQGCQKQSIIIHFFGKQLSKVIFDAACSFKQLWRPKYFFQKNGMLSVSVMQDFA